jgi:dTDP-4-amino-4,6-dideoxygalactose transaminase
LITAGFMPANTDPTRPDPLEKSPVQVTEPFLPPLDEYVRYLEGIWSRNYLTNQGPLLKELEQKLQAYHRLGVPVYCVANGGLGLQLAIQALGVRGEVVTTPFSYVATTACPLWEGCSVTFADIEPDYLTLDPRAVEAAITPRTEAIIATHVFGNPCDVDALAVIAERHGLALIYDAAHAFGVTYKGRSLLEWGDVSVVSMHATKLFHTVEGGFVVASDPPIARKIEWMRRFGHNGPKDFHGAGINAKLSELHAAMGLANYDHLSEILANRKAVCDAYDAALTGHAKLRPAFVLRPETGWNHAYYPIITSTAVEREALIARMDRERVYTRRYFDPSLDKVGTLGGQSAAMPVSHDITSRILCLPLSAGMTGEDIARVTALLV